MQQTARIPNLEQLDERLVPATMVDLTARGASAVVDGGAIVRQVDAQPTGTGHIHSFVRVQGAANGGGGEQGYNTDARPLQFDENKSPQFTRSLTLGDVPVVTVNGVNYREFLLDVNQTSKSPKLSLDEVRVFLGSSPSLSGYDAATHKLANMTAAFAMTTPILLDYRLNSGSGSGDMTLLVPDSSFAGASVNDYVYLYSKMGAVAGAGANSGFEEWAVRSTGVVTPPPPGVQLSSLSGNVYLDSNGDGALDSGELGLVGVVMHLRGLDMNGLSVDLTTPTDTNGKYTFADLLPGTYTIWEEQPTSVTMNGSVYLLDDGSETVGTVGGVVNGTIPSATSGTSPAGVPQNDAIYGIVLGSGQTGVNYNFGELLPASNDDTGEDDSTGPAF